jgi:hypothetical protein
MHCSAGQSDTAIGMTGQHAPGIKTSIPQAARADFLFSESVYIDVNQIIDDGFYLWIIGHRS